MTSHAMVLVGVWAEKSEAGSFPLGSGPALLGVVLAVASILAGTVWLLLSRRTPPSGSGGPEPEPDESAAYASVDEVTAALATLRAYGADNPITRPAVERAVEERVTHLELRLRHDAVTGLPTRSQFQAELETALAACPATEYGVGVILLDLTDFSGFNDEYGPEAGDRMLREVARRLAEAADGHAGAGCLARLGGDEFGLIVPQSSSPTDVRVLADRLDQALRDKGSPSDAVVCAAIGFAESRDGWTVAAELWRNAHLALSQAKESGSAEPVEFNPSMRKGYEAERHIAAALPDALARGEFELHYQPLVRLDGLTVAGHEALIRWHHPERGMVSPGEFVPIAERTGLIVPLGEWIVQEAARRVAAGALAGGATYVSINVSACQLDESDFADRTEAILESCGADPRLVQLEVTETALMRDPVNAIAALRRLEALGCRIALDDFGTGHSTLALLRELPVSVVKLDQAFVQSITTDLRSVAIVRALVAMCGQLSIEVTAEGIETEAQAELLRRLGCHTGQGFWLGAAAPLRKPEAA